jgi:uncharacterized protein YqhQ
VAKFYYGGQAVIEGVMMRGRQHWAVAVRAPDGSIVIHEEPVTSAFANSAVAKWPLVRGVALLWDSLTIGVRALRFSSAVAEEEDAAPSPPPATGEGTTPAAETADSNIQHPTSKIAEARKTYMTQANAGVIGSMVISLGLAVAIFFVLPLLLVGWADQWIPSAWMSNLLEGGIRLALLLGYIWAIGRVPAIARVFGYHGAEHKTINAYEAGVPLTPGEVRRFTLIHPRCGTTFLLIVVVLSILAFVLLGRPPMIWRIVSRIVLVPVVAAVAYEGIRWAAGHFGNPLVRAIMAPGLALQRLTTRPPDDSMLEVGIAALQRVLAADGVVSGQPSVVSGPLPAEQVATTSNPALPITDH